MAQAKRDDNYVPTLLAVSNADGITPVTLYADPTTHRLLVSASPGTLDDLTDVVITSGAQGDVLYHNGTNWVNLSAGTNGHFLKTQGAAANPVWAAATAGAAGSDTQVQFNDGGVNLGGDAGFVYNKTSNVATLGGLLVSGLTASEIVITDASKNLVSAAVATYPSLVELAYVKGVTSAIQTQINTKAPSTSPTFATSVTGSYLTASEMLITGASKEIVSAPVATYPSLTELTYLKGVTSAIQTQFTAKAPLASPTFTGTVTVPVGLTGVLRADTGVVSVDTDVTDIVAAASATAQGKVELATDAEAVTGSDTARAVTPANLTARLAAPGAIGGTTAAAITGTTITANTSAAPDADDGATLGTSSLGWSDLYLATGGNVLVNNANAKRTMVLTAAGAKGCTTSPAAGPTQVEAATNDVNYWVMDFDAASDEFCFWNVVMPDNWDASTVTAKFYWTNAGGGATETVSWDIAARAFADDAAIDQAFGTAVNVDDTWIAQGDVHISAESGAITVGGSPAGGQYVVFRVMRDVSDDTLTGDARLLAVRIKYGINAYSD